MIEALTGILGLDYQFREPGYQEKSLNGSRKWCRPGILVFVPAAHIGPPTGPLKMPCSSTGVKGSWPGHWLLHHGHRTHGFNQIKSVHAMGSGLGLLSGYGQSIPFRVPQPVISVVGDSTFFHAAIPALINLVHNRAKALILVGTTGPPP